MRQQVIRLCWIIVLLAAILGLPPSDPRPAAAQTAQPAINWDDWDVIPGRVLITYAPARGAQIRSGQSVPIDGLALTSIEAPVRQGLANSPAAFISILPDTFIGEFDPADRDRVLRELAADPAVEYFEPDRRRVARAAWGTDKPNDYTAATLWGMERIGAPAVWARQPAARTAVRVAVSEDRFDSGHRDLSAQNSAAQNNASDITNHATHVAGIIAATGNNGQDVAGVANVELVSLDYGASGSGFAQQITWAVNNGVDVINMSWGWCGNDDIDNGDDCAKCLYPAASGIEETAIINALSYIVFVGAAGNDNCNRDANNRAPTPVSYFGVIGVSSINGADIRAADSNFGAYVDLAGPGVGVTSTIPGNMTGGMSGTSMASPHVAGSAAAVLAVRPTYDIGSIRRLLELTAENLGAAGRDDNFGQGLVRVDRAVAAIADRYASTGDECGITAGGALREPFCDLTMAIDATPGGGTVGIVGGSVYTRRTLSRPANKPLTITAVGGTVTIGK